MATRRMSRIKAVWFVGLAIGGPISAFADAESVSIGTFGDWTAYELSDGQRRLCFAETQLAERPVPDERIAGVRLMVTHQAMGYGGDMVRVSLDEAPSEDAYYFLLTFDDASRGYSFDFDEGELPRWSKGYADILAEIKAAESAGRDATLGATGRYSLSGFSEAYEAIRQACPTASETLVPEPVYVSDLRVKPLPPEADSFSEEESKILYREWLSQEPYLEFDVIGRSFFQSEEEETLTLRAMLVDKEERPEYVAMLAEEPKFNYAVLSYATQRIDYFRNGKLLYSDGSPLHSAQLEFGGACAGPKDGRLNLLFSEWSGGASSGMVEYAGRFDPNEGVSWVSIKGPVDAPITVADCWGDQEYWTWGGEFLPCVCGGWHPGNPYNDDLVKWRREFLSAARVDPRMNGDTLSSFLTAGKALVPFALWDARVDLQFQQFESTEYEVVSVKFSHKPEIYDTFQIILTRRRGEDSWLRIYDADVDHRRFDFVEVYGFEDTHLLKRSGSEYESYEDQVLDLNDLLSEANAEPESQH